MAQPPPDPEALVHPSFEVLYGVARSYLPEALRLLKVPPEDVDDLIHDVVLIAHRGLDRYAPRLAYPGEQMDPLRMLKGWLSGIAWRQVVKRRGRAHHRREVPAGDTAQLGASPADLAPSSEQLAAEAQRRRILIDLLQKLRPERAEALVLSAFLGMSAPDIAEALGVNENTVKSRIHRARADAFALVKRLGDDERNALEGTPLLLPFGWAVGSGRSLDDGAAGGGRGLAHAAPMAAAVLAVGIAIGAGLARHGGRAADEPVIAAAREPAIVAAREPSNDGAAEDTATVLAAPEAATVPLRDGPAPARVRTGYRAAPARASASARTAAPRDTAAEEQALLGEARRALQAGAYDQALSTLHAHELAFPQSAFAGDRTWLQREAARRR